MAKIADLTIVGEVGQLLPRTQQTRNITPTGTLAEQDRRSAKRSLYNNVSLQTKTTPGKMLMPLIVCAGEGFKCTLDGKEINKSLTK